MASLTTCYRNSMLGVFIFILGLLIQLIQQLAVLPFNGRHFYESIEPVRFPAVLTLSSSSSSSASSSSSSCMRFVRWYSDRGSRRKYSFVFGFLGFEVSSLYFPLPSVVIIHHSTRSVVTVLHAKWRTYLFLYTLYWEESSTENISQYSFTYQVVTFNAAGNTIYPNEYIFFYLIIFTCCFVRFFENDS